MNKKLLLFIGVVSLLLSCKTQEYFKTENSLFCISPYKSVGAWVFDDAKRKLEQEPFVAGIPEMIERLIQNIPNAENGFILYFSEKTFPGSQLTLQWLCKESNGNIYRAVEYNMEGWLCPALLKFFKKPPKFIYVKATPKI